MSTFSTSPPLLDLQLQEQLCYVHCGHCTTILLVSVPNCSSLSNMQVAASSTNTTVKCGHCNGLLSVNMTRANFLPFHLLSNSLNLDLDHDLDQDQSKLVAGVPENVSYGNVQNPTFHLQMIMSSHHDHDEGDDDHDSIHVVNKPPEKRQRAPSAYNNFIKEEIKRLKAKYPNMSHKQAFSAAAKNWAQFPPIQYKRADHGRLMAGADQRKRLRCSDINVEDQVHTDQGNGFHTRNDWNEMSI